eukprot:8047_1
MTGMTLLCIIVLWLLRGVCAPVTSCISDSELPVEVTGMQLGYTTDPNIVYLFGGQTGPIGADPLTSIYKYNVNEDQYTLLGTTTPTPQFYTISNNILSVNDIIYFVGTLGPQLVYSYAFQVATETWTELPNPTITATEGCLTGNETHLFFIGGVTVSAPAIVLKTLQIYDIYNAMWMAKNNLPVDGWRSGYCSMVNADIYVFGGDAIVSGADVFIDTVFKWDWTEWTTYANALPHKLAYGLALTHLDSIYIIGGMNMDTYVSSPNIYEFDTTVDSITNTYGMVQDLAYPSAGIINNKLYVFGGQNAGTGVTNTTQVCDILSTLPPQITSNPSYSPVVNPIDPTPNPIFPTFAPITTDPTTSLPPTSTPVTLNPASLPPTGAPVTTPITSEPTLGPVTVNPTALPPTSAPVTTPITPAPTSVPVTMTPSAAPNTLPTQPTVNPTTDTSQTNPPTTTPNTLPTFTTNPSLAQHISTTILIVDGTITESTGYPTVSPIDIKHNTADNTRETFLIFGYMFAGLLLGIIALCIFMCCKVKKQQGSKKYSINTQHKNASRSRVEMAPRKAGFIVEDNDDTEVNVNKPAQLVVSDSDRMSEIDMVETKGHIKQASSRMEGEGATIEGMEGDEQNTFNRKLKAMIALDNEEDMDRQFVRFEPQEDIVTKGGLPRIAPPPPPRIVYEMNIDSDQEVIADEDQTTGQ